MKAKGKNQMAKCKRHGNMGALFLIFAMLALSSPLSAWAQAPVEITKAVNAAYTKYKTLQEGKNADYIPALAKVDPNLFGIALVTSDGKVYTDGDVTTEVSIQSISKVFTMARVIQDQGAETIAHTIGVDATGMKFNSIVAVEMSYKLGGGPELNPLVNPGAKMVGKVHEALNA